MKGTKHSVQTTTPDPGFQLSLDDVPIDGALGLLAYGDIGLVAWRDKRAQVEGANWRQKLAEELSREEEALKKSTDGEVPDAGD